MSGLIFYLVANTLAVFSFAAQDLLGDLSKAGKKLFDSSAIPGVTVRECSCYEQNTCLTELKQQAQQCFDSCWYRMNAITDRPQELKQCFTDQTPLLEQFLSCFGTNLHSCYPDENGPQIQKQDFLKLVHLGEEKLESSKETILKSPAVQPIRLVVSTALEFAICVKDCFLKENSAGFCFDRIGCQPLLREDRARRSLKKCLKTIDWKSKAGEFCDCSMNAGVTELGNYCPMLRAMAKKIRVG